MSRKKTGSRFTIIAIIALAVLLAGVIFFLEKGVPRLQEEHPARPSVPGQTVDARRLIRSCLFELGIEREQISFKAHRVTVRSDKEFSRGRLKAAFLPVEDYGRVVVKDTRRVRAIIAKESWEIEFMRTKGARTSISVIPEKPKSARQQQPSSGKEPTGKGARLAIIIDDMGDDLKKARRLAAIDGELTFSVLPQQPHSQEIATSLHNKGRQVMLHLPMQGHEGKDPGKGAIYKDMNPELVRTVMLMDLRSVPYVDGVNNHMGSQVTPQPEIMRTVCMELKRRGLFFIDSLTTSQSVGVMTARECGVSAAARDIFLDNELQDAYITGQLAKLKKVARNHGSAIGICHQHPQTIAVLEREVPRLQREGYRLVRASSFVRR